MLKLNYINHKKKDDVKDKKPSLSSIFYLKKNEIKKKNLKK